MRHPLRAATLALAALSSADDVYDHMESIEPVSPGSPSAPAHYVWDGSDNSQVWLSQQAMRYGVRQIYADAWSAPGYMKTNGSDSRGGYTSQPTSPLTPARPSWESEWADFGAWDPAWDDGTAGDGYTWAGNVMGTLTSGGASAFLYWWGASSSTANSGLIRLQGDSYQTSSRFWALAAFSRFIRPGAVRVAASSGGPGITTAAFLNTGGSTVAELLNTTASPVTTDLDLQKLSASGTAREYVTNGGDSVTQVASAPASRRIGVQLPARSLVTVVVTP